MSKMMMQDVYAGVTLDKAVMLVSDPKDGDIKKAKPKLRFKDEAQRAKHRMDMARRRFIRTVNATFRPGDLYATLTFDDDHEVHTFSEARHIRDVFWRRLRRANKDAAMVIVMGRGKSTSRIHFHLVVQGLTQEDIKRCWTWGMVLEPIRVLRAHNKYDNVDHGADFRGLASYLFDHWSEEQGGHYYKGTRNMRQADRDEPEECDNLYTDKYPPEAPEGYIYIGCDPTPYGYICFHYVRDPKRE